MALRHRRFWLACGWAQLALIVYLSLTPHPPEPMSFADADKIEHAFAYAMLSFWFCQIYQTARLRVIACLTGLGIGLEYAQGWTGYRSYEVLDMLADGTGLLFGWLLVRTPMGRLLAHLEARVADK